MSIAITKKCVNPDSYGMICVKCNQCRRFKVKCLICKKQVLSVCLPINWVEIELLDVFRAQICPDCKSQIAPIHYVTKDGWSHKIIYKREKEFLLKELKNEQAKRSD